MRSQAEVRPAAEGEVVVRSPLDVETVGLRKDGRVAVRGGEHAEDLRVLGERLAAELDVGLEHARGQDDRPVVAEALVHRACHQLRPRAQPGQLGGVADEGGFRS